MKPNLQKLASLAQEIRTLEFQFCAVFASQGYPLKNISELINLMCVDVDEIGPLYATNLNGYLCLHGNHTHPFIHALITLILMV